MRLGECPEGSVVLVVSVPGAGPLGRRLREMGFLPGQRVRVVRNAPLRDPVEVELMGYWLAIRRSEAAHVEVVPWSGEGASGADGRKGGTR